MMREMRNTLENMMRGSNSNGTRPEVVEAEGTGVSCTAAEEKGE